MVLLSSKLSARVTKMNLTQDFPSRNSQPKMAVICTHIFMPLNEDDKKAPTHKGNADYCLLNYTGMALGRGEQTLIPHQLFYEVHLTRNQEWPPANSQRGTEVFNPTNHEGLNLANNHLSDCGSGSFSRWALREAETQPAP
ncbi:uncharacterized protein LOC143643718 [Tamandua tetradactyla]|uniref:uncharacterized protein LOC143643718 n=1 Tax=Tamandua tetradactyla TaxID=48850 RepID=UPI0040546E4B